jgi:serine/threonine protein kinase
MAEAIEGYGPLTLIGRGGFSTVYRGTQLDIGREVAIKVLSFPIDDAPGWDRFQRECLVSGRLSGHPNVVTVFLAGRTSEGSPYLVMEYCPGGSLRTVLEREGPLDESTVSQVVLAVASALQVAHAKGILHRDVKPENVLIDQFGHTRLSDFGIARVIAELGDASASTASYTPDHCAPEQLLDAPTTGAADVYGLGSTAYHLLEGHSPFRVTTATPIGVVITKKITESAPPLARAVSGPLAWFIEQSLQRDQANRPTLDEIVQYFMLGDVRAATIVKPMPDSAAKPEDLTRLGSTASAHTANTAGPGHRRGRIPAHRRPYGRRPHRRTPACRCPADGCSTGRSAGKAPRAPCRRRRHCGARRHGYRARDFQGQRHASHHGRPNDNHRGRADPGVRHDNDDSDHDHRHGRHTDYRSRHDIDALDNGHDIASDGRRASAGHRSRGPDNHSTRHDPRYYIRHGNNDGHDFQYRVATSRTSHDDYHARIHLCVYFFLDYRHDHHHHHAGCAGADERSRRRGGRSVRHRFLHSTQSGIFDHRPLRSARLGQHQHAAYVVGIRAANQLAHERHVLHISSSCV